MIRRLFGGLWGYVAALGAFLAVLVSAYVKGRSDAAQDRAVQDLEDYQDGRKEIDDAVVPDIDAADWLRDRKSKRGL